MSYSINEPATQIIKDDEANEIWWLLREKFEMAFLISLLYFPTCKHEVFLNKKYIAITHNQSLLTYNASKNGQ